VLITCYVELTKIVDLLVKSTIFCAVVGWRHSHDCLSLRTNDISWCPIIQSLCPKSVLYRSKRFATNFRSGGLSLPLAERSKTKDVYETRLTWFCSSIRLYISVYTRTGVAKILKLCFHLLLIVRLRQMHWR
jgi:hypothetical protein